MEAIDDKESFKSFIQTTSGESENVNIPIDSPETKNSSQEKRRYRTRRRIEDIEGIAKNVIENFPSALAIPTLSNWENSLSFYQQGNAYMEPIDILQPEFPKN